MKGLVLADVRQKINLLTSLSSVLYTCCQFMYFVLDLSGRYLT